MSGESQLGGASQGRRAVRVRRPLDARYSSGCSPIPARVVDLSELGMFLDTQHALAVGQAIRFAISLPKIDDAPSDVGAGGPLVGEGRVVWVDPRVGAGVTFERVAAGDRDRLRFFVAAVYFGQLS